MSVAAIDIGSNSCRMLILDDTGAAQHRDMQVTKLGRGVDVTRRLSVEAMDRTLDVLRTYQSKMTEHGVRRLRVTTTSASRDAENRDDFFGMVTEVLGQAPELLSGTEEAALSFQGATSWLDQRTNELGQPAYDLVLDIGGGSTEFAVGLPGQEPVGVWSLDVGGIRLTEQFLHGDPPTPVELSSAVTVMHSHLDDVEREIPSIKTAGRLVGVAAVTSIAAIEIGLQTYDRDRIHQFSLTRAAAEDVFRTLATENRSDRAFNPGLHPDRVDTVVGVALILATVMRHWKHDLCLVSETDSLDASAHSLLI